MLGGDFWAQVQPSLCVKLSAARTQGVLIRNPHGQGKVAVKACFCCLTSACG